jgi:hypothetical protein
MIGLPLAPVPGSGENKGGGKVGMGGGEEGRQKVVERRLDGSTDL